MMKLKEERRIEEERLRLEQWKIREEKRAGLIP